MATTEADEDRFNDVIDEGEQAFLDGVPWTDNPYAPDTPDNDAWHTGWRYAEGESDKAE